jgi:hypothetical protein
MNSIRSVFQYRFIAIGLGVFAVVGVPAHAELSPGIEDATKAANPAMTEAGTAPQTGATTQVPAAQASTAPPAKGDEVESEEVTGSLIRQHHHVRHVDVTLITPDQAAQEGDRQLSDTLGHMPERPH